MFTPDEHARTGTKDHQHFPDEQRQEHQPVVDPNELIASQSEENGEKQNGTGDHEAPKRTNESAASVFRRELTLDYRTECSARCPSMVNSSRRRSLLRDLVERMISQILFDDQLIRFVQFEKIYGRENNGRQ